MRRNFFEILVIGILGLSGFAIAGVPTSAHKALTKAIESSVEWSGHVKNEVAKGTKLDGTHLRNEITNLKYWLEEMNNTYAALSLRHPYEKDEGHFLAVKKHQVAASNLLKELESALDIEAPNYRQMNKLTKRMVKELESAAREHQSELNEFEAQSAN